MRIAFVLASVLGILPPLFFGTTAQARLSPTAAAELSLPQIQTDTPRADTPPAPALQSKAFPANSQGDSQDGKTGPQGSSTRPAGEAPEKGGKADREAGTGIGQGRHLLWSLAGASNTVYLLGSIHFLPKDEPLPEAMRAAYRRADALLMEIDMDDLDPQETQQVMLELGVLPPGQSLEQSLGAPAYATLAAVARDLGLDPVLLGRLRPWLAAVTLVQANLNRKGLDSLTGVEHQLTALARRDGKPIEGLETLREQLGYLAGLSEPLQREFLLYSIEDSERMDRELDEMLTAWRRGELQTLERLLAEGFEAHPELYRPLTTERNRRWIQPIEALLNDGRNHLVVVGALHLVGPDSLVDLLRARGHELHQH